MKKFLCCLLVLLMIVGAALPLISCGKKPEPTPTPTPTPGGEKGYVDDGKTYTYRMGPSDIPEAWNLHTYQSNSSTYVLDYAGDALYTFEYNDDFSGYKIVPSMAAGDPIDVTSEYVGKYGIKAGDTDRVYKIPLKSNLKFDNGEAITADSFVKSMKLLLNPDAANFRADNVYKSGDLKIYNAESYVKQGRYGLQEFVSPNMGADEYVAPSAFIVGSDGFYLVNGFDIVLDLASGGNWGSNGLAAYAGAGYLAKTDADGNALLIMDEATGRAKVFDVNGTWILTRTLEKDTTSEEHNNKNEDGTYATREDFSFYDLDGNKITRYINEEGKAWVYLDKDGNVNEAWAGCNTKYDNVDAYNSLVAAAAAQAEANKTLKGWESTWVKLNAGLLKNVQDCIAVLQGYADVEAYAAKVGEYAYREFEEMAFLGQYFDSLDFSEVGFFAADKDTALVIVLKNAMDDNFYLRYELCTNFFLVYAPLYEKLIKTDGGVYTNSYGTSVDTFVGYGPYKLTSYTEGAEIILERNLNWHGYAAGEYKTGTYMTDRITYNKVTDNATRLNMFLKGQLDSYGLQAEDMKDYLSSKYTYFNDSESTWYLAMNPDYKNLKALEEAAKPILNTGNTVNKTVLTIDAFRQALSYSLDRTEYNQNLSPTSGVAKALLSSMIVADPESGLTYRSLDEAKDAILKFWGLSDKWGEGKEYATRDDAINSITGYDLAGAKTLFNKAYEEAVKKGYLSADAIASGKWEVQIIIGKPADANYYNKGYEFLKTNWTNAVQGTKFEGHLAFIQSATLGSTTFGEYLKTGKVDILFGVGYGGSMFNPYSMMDCFTGSLQYDAFTDKESVMLDIEVDGKVLRASLYDWVSECLQGNTITAKVVKDGEATSETVEISAGSSDPSSRRIAILAAAEAKIMTLSNIFPVSTDATASLRCMRIKYKTEEYIVGMGRGGIEWYTYAMDDAEFADYVKTQKDGVLNYK